MVVQNLISSDVRRPNLRQQTSTIQLLAFRQSRPKLRIQHRNH